MAWFMALGRFTIGLPQLTSNKWHRQATPHAAWDLPCTAALPGSARLGRSIAMDKQQLEG